MAPHRYRHIRIDDFRSEAAFSPPQRDMSGISSGRNRDIHGPRLETELAAALVRAHELLTARDVSDGTEGVYLEVTSAEGSKLPDLNWSSQNIRLGALRVTEAGTETGALFVPTTAEAFLTAKIAEYAHESTPSQKPRHEDKFAPVEVIRAATVESLWTDQRPLPTDLNERIWWECWCWNDRAHNLLSAAMRFNLRASERRLYFPEYDVIPVFANRLEISRLLQNTNAIEELRLSTDTPAFFTVTIRSEQTLWVDELLARVSGPSPAAPAVCILDSGIARAHPLLSAALAADDCLTVDPDWGVDDHDPQGMVQTWPVSPCSQT